MVNKQIKQILDQQHMHLFIPQWPLSSSQVPSKIGNNAIFKALFVKISWPNTATVIRSKCWDTSPLGASNNSDH